MTDRSALLLPAFEGATPWAQLDRLPERPAEFTFALLSDLTGGERPGVFGRAVDATNLIRPDFVIQLGDTIEGYTCDAAEIARQSTAFDTTVARLDVPMFRVPGNHDVSNDTMRTEWLSRYGALHYHFVYRDVLFVALDTQDSPRPGDGDVHLDMSVDGWEGTMPARFSAEQLSWVEQILAEYPDVRWTILCMHMPAWQGAGAPGFDRVLRALGERPYTVFAGHVHNYRRRQLAGRDFIRLGTTGGSWVVPGEAGNFDHLTLVTMMPTGPRIANILLDGVLGPDGGR
ncbi:metallophosphoesterase family protein [Phytoactinopolyspora mesophila]|uniref:Calcineurin-like phosphoesterase domain-containing protein n=1 Tax=Phytoactinopolyspora mesophila TaxID=2650750 RepID=A0A7K3LXV4_9ACTN|nr:metallophosphoesterase [Phytoactinopolyspora mesophila]NDL55800.1 hypothetical protein [Phytoactinopolyspora mesophila]